ncbi:MAG: glycosyltransferase [Crocinitomix sp.]|nr:glycosyltransferase [Crocinitomix sp.]
MKVAIVHNYYKIRGGEATVVAIESAALEKQGLEVISYDRDNREIDSFSIIEKFSLIRNTAWSKESYKLFRAFLKEHQPDICHVHNFLPLFSPSIFQACQDEGIPVVQTLHNYRLICTNGLLMRKGKICELCLGKSAYQAVTKKCYRNSALQTYAVARMIEKNKKNQTWNENIDGYICLTDFAKSKFKQHGLPEEKLYVKANAVAITEEPPEVEVKPYFVFVGRLTESKGVRLLKEIAKQIDIPIWMVGEGELADELRLQKNILVLGKQPYFETVGLIKNATALILPSLWYEGMPMTILEAFALKTPVITSDLGAMQSIIRHKENGLLFQPGSAKDLIDNLNFVLKNVDAASKMAANGFQDYEELYSIESNMVQLQEIYRSVIAAKAK